MPLRIISTCARRQNAVRECGKLPDEAAASEAWCISPRDIRLCSRNFAEFTAQFFATILNQQLFFEIAGQNKASLITQ